MKTKSLNELVGQISCDNHYIKSLLVGIEMLALESREDDIINLTLITKEYSEKIRDLISSLEDTVVKLEK